MDGSWSVGRENFKYIRSFIGALAGAFDIGEDKTRVAVVQYSTDTRTEFPLTRYTRRGDLLQAINSLPYKGGNTMTGKEFTRRKDRNGKVEICRFLSKNLLWLIKFYFSINVALHDSGSKVVNLEVYMLNIIILWNEFWIYGTM